MPKPNVTSTEILRRAKARINAPEKWCKGRSRDGKAMCAGFAIEFECGLDLKLTYEAWGSLVTHIPHEGYWSASPLNKYVAIAQWNDAPHRTHSQVMAVFDKAIKHSFDRTDAIAHEEKEHTNA